MGQEQFRLLGQPASSFRFACEAGCVQACGTALYLRHQLGSALFLAETRAVTHAVRQAVDGAGVTGVCCAFAQELDIGLASVSLPQAQEDQLV